MAMGLVVALAAVSMSVNMVLLMFTLALTARGLMVCFRTIGYSQDQQGQDQD